jgi:hypothetical protein
VSIRFNSRLLLLTFAFALCAAPTIVSYQPYTYRWDDSGYLAQSITASRAFWSGDFHALREAMTGIHPPIMTILGLPWGPLVSWDAAGKCFLSLTVLIALFVALCLFLMLRSGLEPLFLVIASVCLLAAMGPFPAGAENAHAYATAFLADSLFAWVAFAAILLIPYEIATRGSSSEDGRARGILWAAIFSVGAMTKVNFFFFIALIVPILFVIRWRNRGPRSAFNVFLAFAICSLPATLYWLRYGKPALKFALDASFGHNAPLYYSPLLPFLTGAVRQSPGLLLYGVLSIAGIVYLVMKFQEVRWAALPLLVLVGYCSVALASTNREIRFLFSGIIAFPFLIGILISGKARVYSQKAAILAAVLVFCCLVTAGVPVLYRAERLSIQRSEAVLAQAARSNARHILLATDSPTLNYNLMILAIALSPSRPSVETATLAWPPLANLPIEDDFRVMQESDLVVFQKEEALDPPFTNRRSLEYERYAQQQARGAPIKVTDDISVYRMSHESQANQVPLN